MMNKVEPVQVQVEETKKERLTEQNILISQAWGSR